MGWGDELEGITEGGVSTDVGESGRSCWRKDVFFLATGALRRDAREWSKRGNESKEREG
jgi:hypothetical protein